MKNDESFNYQYSSPTESERKQIEDIRNKYINKDVGLAELKKLDTKVTKGPKIIGMTIGIVGLLVFGLGMSMVLEFNLLLWGIIVSIIGALIMLIAYPVYNKIYTNNKKKYQETIIKLSKELLNES